MKATNDFHFKQFTIVQHDSSHKVGTDGVLLGAWTDVGHAKRILDVGTGTGLIALMLAQRTTSDVQIDAIEIQSHDVERARSNVLASPWHQRIAIHHEHFQTYDRGYKYDLIVSNPPFFVNSSVAPDEKRSAARHTTPLPFDDLVSSALRLLEPSGVLAVILPTVESNKLQSLAEEAGLLVVRQMTVFTRVGKPAERILLEFKRGHLLETYVESLIIHEKQNEWSNSYRQLTRDFYLKF